MILAELPLINQRRQTGLKSTLCGKASAMTFCQPSLVFFFLQVKQAERGLEARLTELI